MSRWYSRSRKGRYTGDMKQYGTIPPYAKILLKSPLSGLERCEFDDECDFCQKPRNGSYAQMSGSWEYPDEVDHYICGHCATKHHYKDRLYDSIQYPHYSNFNRWKRQANLSDAQFICEYCDCVAEGECECNGYQYHKRQVGAQPFMKQWIIRVTDADGFVSYITEPMPTSNYSSSSSCKSKALVFNQKPKRSFLDSIFLDGGTAELEEIEETDQQ